MIENPWLDLPDEGLYVLPKDRDAIAQFNERLKKGEKDNRYIRPDILPEPFVGRIDAPIVLLSNNPGHGSDACYKRTPEFLERMRRNLRHEPSEYPFVLLDPTLPEELLKWWRPKVADLVEHFGRSEEGTRIVARSIVNVPYFPYPSKRFGHENCRVSSQEYGFEIVSEAVKRNAVIVRMRNRKSVRWEARVPGLAAYPRVFKVSNTQNPTINRGKGKRWAAFDLIVRAIEESERRRG